MGESEQQKMVNEIYGYAASLVKQGKDRNEIQAALEVQGLGKEIAFTVASNIFDLRKKAMREAALKNIAVGGLFCVGGIVVTVVTLMMAASGGGGGTYVVAWGAVIFGAIQCIRGLFQLFKK